MAIKFSQFITQTSASSLSHIVGYNGADNLQITPTNFFTSFAVGNTGQVSYFDSASSLEGSNEFVWDSSNNRLGIGTSSPGEKLEVDGNIRLGDGAQRNIIGPTNENLGIFANPNGSDEGILFSTDNGTTTEMIILNGGNVGIGTATPSSKLSVDGTLNATGISQLGSSGANVFLTSSSAGNVGIGIAAPVAKLHVYQNNSDDDTTAGVTIEQDGTGDAALSFLLSTVRRWRLGIDNNDLDKFKISSSTNLSTNNKLTIDVNGNVGIGTTSPGQKLDVTGGGVKIQSDGSAAAGAYLELKHANNNSTDVCATINLTNNAGGYASIIGGTTGANNTGYIEFKTDNAGTQGTVLTLNGDNSAAFAGGVTLESGTNGTTNKLIFKTTDNADTSKFIRSNEYYLEFGSNKNEGFKFTDVQFGTTLLQINGGNNSSGNGFNSATFAGDITANSIFLPDNRDIGWNGGYSASKPTLAAVGTTMKMFPSGNAASAQFTLSPTIATFGGTVLLQGDGGNAQKYLAIYNEGTATHDDVVLGFKTHGSRQYSIGIDRSTTNFTLSNLYASVSSGVLLSVDNSGNAIFTGDIQVGGWVKGVNATNTLYSATSLGTYLQSPTNSGTGSNIYFRNTSGTVFQTFSQVAGGTSTFANNVNVTGVIDVRGGGTGYNSIKIANNITADTNKQAGITTENYAGNSVSIIQYATHATANTVYYGSADGAHSGLQNHRFYVNTDVNTSGSGHTQALHIGSNTDATFAGDVIMSKNAGPTLNMNTNSAGNTSKILLHEGTTASPQNGASIRYDGSANAFKIGVGTSVDTTRLTIDRGTGLATFANDVSVAGTVTIANTSGGPIYLEDTDATDTFDITSISNGGGNFSLDTRRTSDNGFVSTDYQIVKDASGANYHRWFTANTERVRINASGYIYVDTDGVEPSASQVGVRITGTQGQAFWNSANSGTTGYNHFNFYNGNGVVGSIVTNGSATAFNTSSDYRLKEDLKDFDGLNKVSKIPVYDFKWKVDDSRSYGVMAHELQEVLPDAVSGEKDAEEMQGVDYSKIVPLLIKSIQELKAEVEDLKSKI